MRLKKKERGGWKELMLSGLQSTMVDYIIVKGGGNMKGGGNNWGEPERAPCACTLAREFCMYVHVLYVSYVLPAVSIMIYLAAPLRKKQS